MNLIILLLGGLFVGAVSSFMQAAHTSLIVVFLFWQGFAFGAVLSFSHVVSSPNRRLILSIVLGMLNLWLFFLAFISTLFFHESSWIRADGDWVIYLAHGTAFALVMVGAVQLILKPAYVSLKTYGVVVLASSIAFLESELVSFLQEPSFFTFWYLLVALGFGLSWWWHERKIGKTAG